MPGVSHNCIPRFREAHDAQPARPLVRLRRPLLLASLLCLISGTPLFAHDPGLSTATIQIKSDKLEAVLVFSILDATQLVDSARNRGGPILKREFEPAATELKQKAFRALEVEFDGLPAKVTETRCRFDESQNATVYLAIPAKAFSKLVVRSKWL